MAVAITTDRLTRLVEEIGAAMVVPDFTVEHWGVYEAPTEQFRAFVLKCFGAVIESSTGVPPVDHGRDGHATIHGYKGAIPVWVGESNQKKGVTAADVQAFDYGKRFSSTPGYSFVCGSKKEPELHAQYEFPTAGTRCRTTWAARGCGAPRLMSSSIC
jgi:hypothetical protein